MSIFDIFKNPNAGMPDQVYYSLDVETANRKRDSLCQIGIVAFHNLKEDQPFSTYVNPEMEFDPYCSSIHKITAYKVREAPKIPLILEALTKSLTGQIVVHHTAFDQQVIEACYKRFDLPVLDCSWVDSANVIRTVWPKYQKQGYGLADLAKDFNIQFKHHDALDDARVAGLITALAIQESKIPIQNWVSMDFQKPQKFVYKPKVNPEIDARISEGQDVLVFTGDLSVDREEAADKAINCGYAVHDRVTRKTTILVVGYQNLDVLGGHEKSSKQRYAEELISKGQRIRIMTEEEFHSIIDQ